MPQTTGAVFDPNRSRDSKKNGCLCDSRFLTTDTKIACIICAYRFHAHCVEDGGFVKADIDRIMSSKSQFKLVCRYCQPKVKDHVTNEDLVDTKKQMELQLQFNNGNIFIQKFLTICVLLSCMIDTECVDH